ncbi:1,2-phenylacetyl-CoA epoxidase subunit PaaD [Azospirillum canadense]|uniref:1,2-phenylacetyl-CoA epoxidase subunit PaaD n=1 Tax=Azospirillum canadense TaxID=403962 RepID=UPI002227612C|nr:1,2-phenylacetyl-CoA epoxidase subunit PaaD [Azospirillum canadense]MCW2240001.1 ring-1,2-phenylacetyl-CoA epoxidase subunit PaaD [Azospirillum canadense]
MIAERQSDHGVWGPGPGDDATLGAAWEALRTVMDPEIPVLSVVDLGMIRGVEAGESGRLRVRLSPTYSGCPATGIIALEVARALDAAGFPNAEVVTEVAPPWTTDWISPAGLDRLRESGIAPPPRGAGKRALVAPEERVACPLCGSTDTEVISAFGSTACKALHRCRSCLEPFDSFKCI